MRELDLKYNPTLLLNNYVILIVSTQNAVNNNIIKINIKFC